MDQTVTSLRTDPMGGPPMPPVGRPRRGRHRRRSGSLGETAPPRWMAGLHIEEPVRGTRRGAWPDKPAWAPAEVPDVGAGNGCGFVRIGGVAAAGPVRPRAAAPP